MAFLIPDNLGSRKDVPETIRRVARAFQIALEDDATVWYEPLFDPQGQRSHLVVLEPRMGVLVLEVLKGKDRSRLLGAIRGSIRIELDGEEREVDNPLERAVALAGALREALAGKPAIAHVPVGAGAAFSGVTREDADSLGIGRLLNLDHCIFKPDIDAAVSGGESRGLLQVMTRTIGSLDEELTREQIDALRAVVHPDVVITPTGAQGALFTEGTGSPEDTLKVMDRKQEAFAKSLGHGHRVIRGVAGSGKTLVLVSRARQLGRLLPHHRVLVTCYTRSLASLLKAQLEEFPNVEVVHLDRLMARAIHAAGMEHPGYDDGGAGVTRTALEAIRARHGTRYRAVMIDEAQDFDTDALKFCVELLEATDPEEQDLIVVADSAQNIFRRKFRWKDAGISAQGRTRLLRVNYRNTREILEFAHKFLTADPDISVDEAPDPEDELSIIPAESAERSGPLPVVMVARDADEEIRSVVQAVQRAYTHRGRSRSRSIAVLHGELDSGSKRLPWRLMSELRAASIPVFWATDPTNKRNKDIVGSVDDPVIVSTIHSAKGLEFPHVIVCGLGVRDDETTARKLLYVGFTRAVDRLTVVTTSGSRFQADVLAATAQPPIEL